MYLKVNKKSYLRKRYTFAMSYFVNENSVVRKIWGRSDMVLFIFAGAAAEFALNKAVDWLYFTGKLPSDPLGRLFSTVRYAHTIIYSSTKEAHQTIDTMRHIHSSVEQNRGVAIPDWAYRDVLFLLIYYSIASYELLERKLTVEEKEEVYSVFHRVGIRMGLKALPSDYIEWLPARKAHLIEDLQPGNYTIDLFRQYRKHLGAIRYFILIEVQKLIIPKHVRHLLDLSRYSWLAPAVPVYKLGRQIKLDKILRAVLLPAAYKTQMKTLEVRLN